ncbi:putative dehydrogenase [Frigoribacterium sp. PhB160]|uniref:Gfo/Idh/MocA family protein n=1 Tax=Frigoribacterium sp. PhB160 TaxID=2485192 RepID=UPI000F9EE5B6|nr:Gfo/Idh/MocA family oxidoreductase [Frigoribacterium sp. PhB160]ROS61299.1 putative dehydrogenase [Frigoribacterium sp. PhB160]
MTFDHDPATAGDADVSTSTTPRDLRVGVIGLGFAGSTHLEAFSSLPGATVVALAGQEEARLHELGSAYGVERLVADWQDVVAMDDLDVISIGVPNALHHPIAMAALRSGKHVFCEKPLATTGDLAAEMVAAARDADRVLEVAYNHRRRADVAFLADWLADDPIGDVYHARASWMRRAGVPGMGSWFTNKSASGGGPMIDLGSHVLDIALHLLGEPRVTSVSAVAYGVLGAAGRGGRVYGVSSSPTGAAFDVEDFSSALLRFDDGGSLQLQASWASYSKVHEDIEVELLGATGGARLHVDDYATDGTLTLYSDVLGQPAVTRPVVHVPSGHHRTVIEGFIASVQAGQAPGGAASPDATPRYPGRYGEYALHRSRVVDAIYASAEQGREIEVPQDDPASADRGTTPTTTVTPPTGAAGRTEETTR